MIPEGTLGCRFLTVVYPFDFPMTPDSIIVIRGIRGCPAVSK